MTPSKAQMSDQAKEGKPKSRSDQILEKFPLVPVLDRVKEECEKYLLNDMLDRIQRFTIQESPGKVEFFNLPIPILLPMLRT